MSQFACPNIWSSEGQRGLNADVFGPNPGLLGGPRAAQQRRPAAFGSDFAPGGGGGGGGGFGGFEDPPYKVHGDVEGRQHRFSPYEFNGGSNIAVAGDDYVVVAADTRLATGYSILSRHVSRCLQLTPTTIIASGGCWADIKTLHKKLRIRATQYQHAHSEDMSVVGAAQLLSNTLYFKRFFPYYAFNVVAGLDHEGKGAMFNYDAIGSYQRVVDAYGANGNAAKLIMPVLDNLFGGNGVSSGLKVKPNYTKEEVVEIVKDCFITAGERDIMCGDAVDIYVMTKEGTTYEQFKLKAD